MGISGRDKQALLVLGGVAVFIGVYLGVFNTFNLKKAEVETEISTLEIELAALEDHNVKLPIYEEGIEVGKEYMEEKLPNYPTMIYEEDALVWAINLNNTIGSKIGLVGFSSPSVISTFPGTVEIDGVETAVEMSSYRRPVELAFEMSYDQFKTAVDAVYETDTIADIQNVTASYDAETALLDVSVTANQYYLNWPGAEYTPERLPYAPVGVPTIVGIN